MNIKQALEKSEIEISNNSLISADSWLLNDSYISFEDFLIPHFIDFIERRYALYLEVGVELEFYLLNISSENLERFLAELQSTGINCQKERGENQYEVIILHQRISKQFLQHISGYKAYIESASAKYGINTIFDGMPYENDYGSATHFHVSAICIKDNRNLFSEGEIAKNKLLLNFIAGILKNVKAATYFLIGDLEAEYKRFRSEFLAPTHIAWGGNNRTALVRIPDSPKQSRRFEFRLPSSSSDMSRSVLFLLVSLITGIEEGLLPIPRLYGNAYDPQYSLTPLSTSVCEAKNEHNFDYIMQRVFFLTLL